ncbi:FKBP-type peptidyl-prolyl cis-trans isomerase [Bifidobacterium aquikefiricola]|uniref:peptidylprolyl isomerase n=1 Tax=Bifidobacterium aquikefiricola TaxID=3059038 RepID=A0AB39U5I2_9BIFI
MHQHIKITPLIKLFATVCSLTLAVSLAACGNGSSSASSSSSSPTTSSSATGRDSTAKLTGVTAKGALGKKPTISFKTPLKASDGASAILQEGDGATIKDGDRVCYQGIALSAETGKEVQSTWEANTPQCDVVVNSKSLGAARYKLFEGQKLNTTIAIASTDTSQTTSSSGSYVMALTFVSLSKALTRAEGDKVTDIPSNLPKVTLASNGKPSIDLNGYTPGKTLVVQTLIKGKGATVKDTNTVSANYTGWLASDAKQFDSSWDRGSASDFSLSQVISGWKKGLAGQTVGSQVLLIVPPDEGYGSTAQNSIPANSTLIFVVDILAAY